MFLLVTHLRFHRIVAPVVWLQQRHTYTLRVNQLVVLDCVGIRRNLYGGNMRINSNSTMIYRQRTLVVTLVINFVILVVVMRTMDVFPAPRNRCQEMAAALVVKRRRVTTLGKCWSGYDNGLTTA